MNDKYITQVKQFVAMSLYIKLEKFSSFSDSFYLAFFPFKIGFI